MLRQCLSALCRVPIIRVLQGSFCGDLKIDRLFNSEITGNMKTAWPCSGCLEMDSRGG